MDDGYRTILILSLQRPPCDEGGPATVTGTFELVERPGPHVFYDEVDATRVVCH